MVLLAALALVAAAASPGERARTPQPIGDIAQRFGPDAYPPAAMRAGEEGRVAVRLAIDAAGRPEGCTVVTSSGSATLDAGTCAIATAHLLFTPALDARGHAVAGQFPLAVRWVLPQPVVPEAPQGCTFPGSDADAREKERACRAIMQSFGGSGGAVAPAGRGDDRNGTPR